MDLGVIFMALYKVELITIVTTLGWKINLKKMGKINFCKEKTCDNGIKITNYLLKCSNAVKLFLGKDKVVLCLRWL